MFSVVIPLYNKEKSILNTIRSVLEQTVQEFEIVVVNDGSTDSSAEIVASMNDPRIRLVNQENRGVSSARNLGIKEAKFEWIAFLDADDLWMESHLEVLSEMIIKFSAYKVFCTSFIRSNQNFPKEIDSEVIIIEDYFKEAIKDHFFWTSVVAINKEVFSRIGVFKEFISRGEDLDLWARIGSNYRIIKSNRITATYVQVAENKLTLSKVSIKKSIVYHISLDGLGFNEKKYFKLLIINKIKSSIMIGDLKTVIMLLLKYHFKLI